MVFQVGAWTLNFHARRGFSSISPRPTPRSRRTTTCSPRTTAGAAPLWPGGTRISACMSGGPARRTTPRDPLSIAIDATSPVRSTAGVSAGARDAMTCVITIIATLAASAACKPADCRSPVRLRKVSLRVTDSETSSRTRSASFWAETRRRSASPRASTSSRHPAPGRVRLTPSRIDSASSSSSSRRSRTCQYSEAALTSSRSASARIDNPSRPSSLISSSAASTSRSRVRPFCLSSSGLTGLILL